MFTKDFNGTNLTDAQDYDIISSADGCCKKRNGEDLKARLDDQKGKWYIVLDHTIYGKRQRKTIGTGLSATEENRPIAERMMQSKKAEWEAKEMETGHILDFNIDDKPKTAKETKKFFPKSDIQKDIAEMQFSEYMDFWLDKKRNTIEQSTFSSYEYNIRRVIMPYFSQYDVKLKEINAYQLEQFYSDMKEERGIKNETIRRYHALIKSALKDAYFKDIIVNNPADKVTLPKKEKYYAETYSEDQVYKLINYAKETGLYIPILLASITAMRRSEVLGLRWKDIDFDNKLLYVRGQLKDRVKTEDAIDGLLWEPKGKTASSLRGIEIDDTLLDILKTEKEQQKERAETIPDYNSEWSDYICLRTKKPNAGKIIKPNCLSQMYSKMLDDCGMPHIRFHDLRHTVTKILHEHGVPIEKIQKLLGHSDIQTTVNIYGHLKTTSERACVSTMTNIITGSM